MRVMVPIVHIPGAVCNQEYSCDIDQTINTTILVTLILCGTEFNLPLIKLHFVMPSTKKQKAREKRARQSDVMSDVENLDLTLGTYSRNELVEQENNSEIGMYLDKIGRPVALFGIRRRRACLGMPTDGGR